MLSAATVVNPSCLLWVGSGSIPHIAIRDAESKEVVIMVVSYSSLPFLLRKVSRYICTSFRSF